MAVVVKVANDGYADALLVELLDNARNGRRCLFVVDGDAYQFRPGARQRGTLLDGRSNVGGIGVGHRLHHNGCIRADAHAANGDGHGLSTRNHSHGKLYFNTHDPQF